MSRQKYILFFILWLPFRMVAQQSQLQVLPLFEYRHHFTAFKGDFIKTTLASSSPIHTLSAGVRYRNFDGLLSYSNGTITAGSQQGLDYLNFQSKFIGSDLQFRWKPFPNAEFSPYLQTGLGYSWFSSYSDIADANGKIYHGWTDGTIRDLPESEYNKDLAQKLTRDFSYETAIALDQKSLYVPIQIGVEFWVSHRVRVYTAWQLFLMQSDNMDRNTNSASWDRMQSFNAGIGYSFRKQKKAVPVKGNVAPVIDYKLVDFKAIWYQDEDHDGVSDVDDKCYGTPVGAPVDKFGCPSDSDQDGIIDFQDAELNSPADKQIHPNGQAFTDAETQKHYNDSISYTVRTLRRFHKNSRPYPIRKYIPESNYKKYAQQLEKHPEWLEAAALKPKDFPADLVIFDLNHDRYISVTEIEQAAQALFEGDAKLSVDLLQKAIKYVFENQ